MTHYSIHINADLPTLKGTDLVVADRFFDLLEQLCEFIGEETASGTFTDSSLAVTFNMNAPDPGAATLAGIEAVRVTCERTGLGEPSIQAIETLTYEALDARLETDLIGGNEIAELLGVGHDEMHAVVFSDGFPPPAVGMQWNRPAVEAYLAEMSNGSRGKKTTAKKKATKKKSPAKKQPAARKRTATKTAKTPLKKATAKKKSTAKKAPAKKKTAAKKAPAKKRTGTKTGARKKTTAKKKAAAKKTTAKRSAKKATKTTRKR